MVKVPFKGGSLSIGMVGAPRFVNPILANEETDRNLTTLIYSGLMRKTSDGDIIPDLAEKYEVSDNGLTYTFTLKDNLYFQDGTPLTADDVIFTITSTKDPIIKSPYKIKWDGISVNKIDDKTVEFALRQPFASFLENTTIGIMPKHLWSETAMELNSANTNPVGSGPYMVNSIDKQSSGSINSYKLVPFKKFALGEAYIQNLNLHFYQNEEDLVKALLGKEVDQINSITPQDAKILEEKKYQVKSPVLPRIFGLFFNQNQNQLFIDKSIIKAIDQAIDKEKIVQEVLLGYGVVADGPIPKGMASYHSSQNTTSASREEVLQGVRDDLAKDGWKPDEDGFLEKTVTENKKKVVKKLEFSISTSNIEELAKTAELVKNDLALVGIKVEVKTFENGNLNQNVIRPRKYDALLFGEVINSESDLFAFWHSSQRKDPGLNVAMYTSSKADRLLEDAFVSSDKETREGKYGQLEDEIRNDRTAIFLYSPDSIYTIAPKLDNVKTPSIIVPGDQYLNAYLWYTQTENVWKIFAK